jgi:hypothetical protein
MTPRIEFGAGEDLLKSEVLLAKRRAFCNLDYFKERR